VTIFHESLGSLVAHLSSTIPKRVFGNSWCRFYAISVTIQLYQHCRTTEGKHRSLVSGLGCWCTPFRLIGLEPVGSHITKCVTNGKCDIRETADTFEAASLPCGWY